MNCYPTVPLSSIELFIIIQPTATFFLFNLTAVRVYSRHFQKNKHFIFQHQATDISNKLMNKADVAKEPDISLGSKT